MDRTEVLARRLATQRLTGRRADRAVDVVERLTGVQSQEHAHAFFSIGMRTDTLDEPAVRAEFDTGAFVRTHILRPTWHYVAAGDLRWMMALTTARVQQVNQTVLRREGLDRRTLERGTQLVADALAGGCYLTRTEVGRVFAAAGLPGQGFGLAYVLMHAELKSVICSGPMRGRTHTYALLDERIPPGLDRTGDLTELAYRFFVGHGPASATDFGRWAGLTKAQVRQAVSGLEGRLDSCDVEGTRLWFDPAAPAPPGPTGPYALLLPLYDEVTLSYPHLTFLTAAGHPRPRAADSFVGSVVCDGIDVGTWRREVKGPRVEVRLALAPGVGPDQRQATAEAAQRLAAFLDRTLSLSWA